MGWDATLRDVQRNLLIAAAVVVAGALVALIIWSRSNTADPAPVVQSEQAEPTEREAKASASRTSRPALKDDSRPAAAGESPPTTREYINRRGTLVRDHRNGEHEDYNPDVVHSPRKSKVESRVVQGVRAAVYDTVRGCAGTLTPEAFGEKPRAQAEIVLSIDNGLVTADQALIKLGDLEEEAGTAFATCIQQQAEQLAFPAEGHAAVSQYRVTLVFPLR